MIRWSLKLFDLFAAGEKANSITRWMHGRINTHSFSPKLGMLSYPKVRRLEHFRGAKLLLHLRSELCGWVRSRGTAFTIRVPGGFCKFSIRSSRERLPLTQQLQVVEGELGIGPQGAGGIGLWRNVFAVVACFCKIGAVHAVMRRHIFASPSLAQQQTLSHSCNTTCLGPTDTKRQNRNKQASKLLRAAVETLRRRRRCLEWAFEWGLFRRLGKHIVPACGI